MTRGEVLVAIINNLEDMRLAREAGWYRIPVSSVGRWVMETINRLDGLDHTTGVPVRYDPNDPLDPQQLGLFDQEA